MHACRLSLHHDEQAEWDVVSRRHVEPDPPDRDGLIEGFSKRYGLKTLVWYERHDNIEAAIRRETAMKRWLRAWKVKGIMARNPEWRDLHEELIRT